VLTQAHARGAAAALAHFGIKTSGILGSLGRAAFGAPARAFVEGGRAFRSGGMLSAKNVFWPAVSGPGGSKMNWLQRASTVASGVSALGALRAPPNDGQPHEGRASRLLGAAGGIAGQAYGYPALGMVGGPLLGMLGSRVGRGIGGLVG